MSRSPLLHMCQRLHDPHLLREFVNPFGKKKKKNLWAICLEANNLIVEFQLGGCGDQDKKLERI